MIRTVIFDIGNVLAGFAWHEYYEKLGFDAAMADRLGRATVLSGDWNEYDRGCMSDEAIVSLFVENDPEIEAEIRQAVSSITGIMTHYGYAVDWVKELKRKGYRVLVLSNISRKILQECWLALDFLPYMDGGSLSFQDKVLKPRPEIYHLILDRYHLKAEECVFLDDMQMNVEAAKRLGIHGICFENQAQAMEELKKMGVE